MSGDLQTQTLDTITTEILVLKRQTAQNIIEIGRRLLQAKEMVGHGNWLPYLEQKVQFSRHTANNFMKVAAEAGNVEAFLHLEPSKVYLLLEAPPEERTELGEKAAEMTTRQLEEAVREANRAKREAEEARKRAAEAEAKARELANRPPQVVEKTVEVVKHDPEMAKKHAEMRKEYDQLCQRLEQVVRERDQLAQKVDRTADLDTQIRAKQAELDRLKALMKQMSADFEDGHRDPNGGERLMTALLPVDGVLLKAIGDAMVLKERGVGGPMNDDKVKELSGRLKQLAALLDAILSDRASRPINITPVEVR